MYSLLFTVFKNSEIKRFKNHLRVIGFIAQLSCSAHLIALLLKPAFDADLLASTLLVVLLKASPEQKSLPICGQETSMISYLAPSIDGATRWNSKEPTVSRLQYFFPDLMHILPEGFSLSFWVESSVIPL